MRATYAKRPACTCAVRVHAPLPPPSLPLTHTRARWPQGRALLVVPANVLFNFKTEFNKWLPDPGSPDYEVSGLRKERVFVFSDVADRYTEARAGLEGWARILGARAGHAPTCSAALGHPLPLGHTHCPWAARPGGHRSGLGADHTRLTPTYSWPSL